jgi:hypothetical protein
VFKIGCTEQGNICAMIARSHEQRLEMAKAPSQRARRAALAIIVLGPLLFAAALVEILGPSLTPTDSRFAQGDESSIAIVENGATALVSRESGGDPGLTVTSSRINRNR